MKQEKPQAAHCDSCIHHAYDEEMLSYYCDLMLDEDDMMRYSISASVHCPFYQFNDEYINVRKQI